MHGLRRTHRSRIKTPRSGPWPNIETTPTANKIDRCCSNQNRPILVLRLYCQNTALTHKAKSADLHRQVTNKIGRLCFENKSADFVLKAKSADFVLKTKSARAAPFLASGGLVGSHLPSRRRPARLWRAGLAKLRSRWRGLGPFPGVGSTGRGQAALEGGGEGALRLCA